MGIGLPIYLFWIAESALGALFGQADSRSRMPLGIDFLLPIYFLGLVIELSQTPAAGCLMVDRQRHRLDRSPTRLSARPGT
jgi:predicted branched-subunit amino acid permease